MSTKMTKTTTATETGSGGIARREQRALLLGFGDVGTRCVELMLRGVGPVSMTIVGISDSSGGLFSADGLPMSAILEHKRSGKSLKSYRNTKNIVNVVDDSTVLYDMCKKHNLGIVIDASPVDLKTGGVALPIVRDALDSGISCVLANKAPLVIDYTDLKKRADASPACRLLFSATVCGGLPVVNVGRRDLRGAKFRKISGIFNSTSNYVLSEIEKGSSKDAALLRAQKAGIAEADPTLDIEGYDTANKLVILTNAVAGVPCTLSDVKELVGIQDVTRKDIDLAKERGETIRLVASAEFSETSDGRVSLASLVVRPRNVAIGSFFGRCNDTSMCVEFATDIYETIQMKTDEKGVYPTSAAVLRDCYDACGEGDL